MGATEGDRLKTLGKLFQLSLGEPFSVLIELYHSRPYEVCLHIYFRTFLIVHRTFAKLFLRLFAFKAFCAQLHGRIMPSHDDHQTGSGLRIFHDNNATKLKVWQKSHQVIWLASILFALWSSDQPFFQRTQRETRHFAGLCLF